MVNSVELRSSRSSPLLEGISIMYFVRQEGMKDQMCRLQQAKSALKTALLLNTNMTKLKIQMN